MLRKRTLLPLLVCFLTGCVFGAGPEIPGQQPTVPSAAAQSGSKDAMPQKIHSQTAQRSPCPAPEGWYVYQMQLNETLYSLAARAQVSVDEMLRQNCLNKAVDLSPGSWVYAPAEAFRLAPQTFLPLSISALVADPEMATAGGTVNLTWNAQGPVIGVRVGWVYNDQFIEEAANLPAVGTLALPVPTDGRESITYMVRISDGLHEVAAQTFVHVRCPESWFFLPAPSGCPTPPLITTFHEQRFERGIIVYAPTLGQHYVMINGQPAVRLPDTFVPGMPLTDPSDVEIPAGFFRPSGPLDYAWHSDDTLHGVLGYAISGEMIYPGMFQRAVSPLGEIVYFSASDGQIYRFASGQAWQIVTPQ
jgi:hypothetical protein